ncbi:MAG TPA: J domain-containing protein [Dehalococcoidia bacterium]|nr:J domain-containing protein [Dehalococcoidia bacterium]
MSEPRDAGHDADDLYAALQVSPSADTEIIEAAYRVLARRYHPDLNPSPDATERMALINAAWDTLRDPARRAAYDRRRAGAPLNRGGPAPAPQEPASPPVERPGPAPTLIVEPERIVAALRHGARRSVRVSAYTEPPGIRVEAGVAYGQGWLEVRPAVLRGLVKEDLTVSLHTHGLSAGTHRGGISIATSWETRLLLVDLRVRPAGLLYRLGAFLRYGPSGQGSAVPLLLGMLLLILIVAGLAVLAVGR